MEILTSATCEWKKHQRLPGCDEPRRSPIYPMDNMPHEVTSLPRGLVIDGETLLIPDYLRPISDNGPAGRVLYNGQAIDQSHSFCRTRLDKGTS